MHKHTAAETMVFLFSIRRSLDILFQELNPQSITFWMLFLFHKSSTRYCNLTKADGQFLNCNKRLRRNRLVGLEHFVWNRSMPRHPLPKRKPGRHLHFNTSYVTVQLLHLCILYFSSYQIVVAVSTFFIIFSNDKYFFSQKSKTSLKAWKHQALSIPLSFCSWKTATIKTWKQKETAMAKQQPLKSFVFFIQSWYRL